MLLLSQYLYQYFFQGKGYPDVSTRRLIKRFLSEREIPAFILVDSDPHGIEIMFTYRFGSIALANDVESLAYPDLIWIGLKPSDAILFGIDHEPLSDNDTQKIKCMVSRPYISDAIKKEIDLMMKHNQKSEIEALYKLSPTYLVDEFLINSIISNNKEYKNNSLNKLNINDSYSTLNLIDK